MTESDHAPALTRTRSLVLSVVFLALVLAGLLAASGVLAVLGPGSIDPRAAALVGQLLMLLVPALALLPLMPQRPRALLAPPLVGSLGALMLVVAIPIGWMAAAGAQLATMGALEHVGWSGLASAQQRVIDVYGALLSFDGAASIAATILLVSVVGPIIEELAFRGVLQRLLAPTLGSGLAIVGSAVLFSALHFEPLGVAPRALLGVGCGIAAHRFDSLLPAIAIHGACNGLSLCLALAVGAPTALGVSPSAATHLLPAVVLATACGAAFLGILCLIPVRSARSPTVVQEAS